jgi:hypothetical protein
MDKENTNGFPTNGGFPDWIMQRKCSNCGDLLKFSSYLEVGFELNKKESGRLLVRYCCPNCSNESTINFGGNEEFPLERLATLVIQHSKIMREAEKKKWIKKHIGDKKKWE